MNNLYTERATERSAHSPTPRNDKLRIANEKLAKAKNERENREWGGEKKKGVAAGMTWVEDIETTTYIEEHKSSPNLERRDSITLQQTLNGANTVFGIQSDSPRWKKVAVINRMRAKKKMDRKAASVNRETALPSNVVLVLDSDEEEKDGEEGKVGEDETSDDEYESSLKEGEESKFEKRVRKSRGRVDSMQLHQQTGGHNTTDTYVSRKLAPSDDDTPYSPSLSRVRQLNKDRKRAGKAGLRKKSASQLSFD